MPHGRLLGLCVCLMFCLCSEFLYSFIAKDLRKNVLGRCELRYAWFFAVLIKTKNIFSGVLHTCARFTWCHTFDNIASQSQSQEQTTQLSKRPIVFQGRTRSTVFL